MTDPMHCPLLASVGQFFFLANGWAILTETAMATPALRGMMLRHRESSLLREHGVVHEYYSVPMGGDIPVG